MAYHNRQPVMLERGEYGAWLDTGALPTAAIKPTQTGLLKIEPAVPVAEPRRLIMVRE